MKKSVDGPPPTDPDVVKALRRDKDGLIQLLPGRKALAGLDIGNDRTRTSGRMQSLADIVQLCIRQTNHPVVDKTGLTGTYDFNLDFAVPALALLRAPAQTDPSQAGPADHADPYPDFIAAVQEQLGLKMNSTKLQVQVLVVDHAESVPTEN